ncbi:MAG TPA: cyclodeaminase/cyclohydrolase family protein [Methylophilaceae bacterium]|nr:cyclodeaminase/cyclohydrolase family protein [Methylophilaceae bacterium]
MELPRPWSEEPAMMKQLQLEQFLDQLASNEATPGGGSAAALMGAMGAALVSMVANLTIDKPKYAEVREEIEGVLRHSENLRIKLTKAMQNDVNAYHTVMAAYAMPKDTEQQKSERSEAIQNALKLATDAPLSCARLALEVMPLARRVAEIGNVNAIADSSVAAIAAHAALRSAVLNILVNTSAIHDKDFNKPHIAEAEHLLARGAALETAIFNMVKRKIITG